MVEVENITNQIIHADCMDILKQLPDKCIDLVLTDPPYGITNCKWDVKLDLNNLFYDFNRISKRQVIFGTEPFTSMLILNNLENFKERITWKKHKASNFGNVSYRLLKYTEDICVFGEGVFNKIFEPRKSNRVLQAQKGNAKQWRTNRKDTAEVSFGTLYQPNDWNNYSANEKLVGNLWEMPSVVSTSKEKCNHPTQKPVAVIERILKIYSNKNDLILDCFSGSGTTAIACHNLNRRFICIEKDPDYWKTSVERLKTAQAQTKLDLYAVS